MIDRLERIERLERAGAPPERLLDELRLLVRAAERWADREGDEAALVAVDGCRVAVERASTRLTGSSQTGATLALPTTQPADGDDSREGLGAASRRPIDAVR